MQLNSSSSNEMSSTDKIKVLVLGDSGVGKSCLVNLICNQNRKSNPSWTIGCCIEVKAHEFAEGTPKQKTYLLELWDVGGNKTHASARHIFFSNFHAILLVHDLTNSKSRLNLRKWLAEVMYAGDGHPPIGGSRQSLLNNDSYIEYDNEMFIDKLIPKLVIGTKLDLMEQNVFGRTRASSLADELGADEIFVNSFSTKSFAPGSTNSVTLSRFFDKAIEKKMKSSNNHMFELLDTATRTSPKYTNQFGRHSLLNNRYPGNS